MQQPSPRTEYSSLTRTDPAGDGGQQSRYRVSCCPLAQSACGRHPLDGRSGSGDSLSNSLVYQLYLSVHPGPGWHALVPCSYLCTEDQRTPWCSYCDKRLRVLWYTDISPSTLMNQHEQHTLIFLDWQTSDSISVMETIASGSRFPDPVDPSYVYENTLIYEESKSAPMPFVSGLKQWLEVHTRPDLHLLK